MKVTLIIVTIFAMHTAFTQSLSLSGRVEQTVKGTVFESSFGYAFSNNISAGLFYQTGAQHDGESMWRNRFTGGLLNIPLFSGKGILFGACLRAGLVDNRFFVVVPGLETKISLARTLDLTSGAGYRYGYPSCSAGLSYKLISRKPL